MDMVALALPPLVNESVLGVSAKGVTGETDRVVVTAGITVNTSE
jgi:hypothetical protein